MITDTILPVRPEGIPDALRQRDLWIVWSAEERTSGSGETYSTKVPRSARTGSKCDATDPASGVSFDAALSAYRKDGFDGIGIMLHSGWGLVGIDEDGCRHPETGIIAPAAATRMRMLNSYTEVSPSGTGTRTFVFGEKPGARCKDPAEGFEMYDETRFLTVTGHHVEGTPEHVEERPQEIEAVYQLVFGSEPEKSAPAPAPAAPNGVEDRQLIEKARENAGFAALWAGDTSAYGGDHSSADLALCNHLAFWTGRDARRMEVLFRQSGLMREKWEREDYRTRTIEKAVASCSEVYTPRRNGSSRRGPSTNGQAGWPREADGARNAQPGEEPHAPLFWSLDEDGDADVSLSDLVDWLESRGFYKTYEYGRDSSTKIEERRNLIRRRSEEQIRDYVLDHLREEAPRSVLSKVRRAANHYLSSKTFNSLKAHDIDPLRDERTAAYFPYQNGVVRVTPDDVDLLPYGDLDRPVWRDSVLDRRVELEKDYGNDQLQEGEFGLFQWKAMKQDTARMKSLMSAQGYLAHGYKNPAQARAVIFMDEVISDDPAGRTGKGLSARAYGHMTPTKHVDARRIDLRNRFALQSVVPGVTRLVHFNDAGERFPFEKLFAAITDDMSVERKNRDRVVIPFEDSPKFLISTNFVISGRGGSHDGRVFEVEFGDHFTKDHTPEDEFGHLLFDEWGSQQWSYFDNYMLRCVQFYMQHGLVDYDQVNLAWKKFVQTTTPEFADFVQAFDFEANKPGTPPGAQQRYKKDALLDSFNETQRQDCTPHTFTKWLKAYAEYQEWEIKNRLGADRKQIAFYCADNA